MGRPSLRQALDFGLGVALHQHGQLKDYHIGNHKRKHR